MLNVIMMFMGVLVGHFLCRFYIIIKRKHTNKMYDKIYHAIYLYAKDIDCPSIRVEIYTKMKPFHEKLFTFFDWNDKNILPEKDYEKIKKYIDCKEEDDE